MKKIIALVLALAMLAGLSACGISANTLRTNDNSVIKIGVFEPLTGDYAANGKLETLGIMFANYIQPTITVAGKEYNVELVTVDNGSSKAQAASSAKKLIDEGCSVVLGSYGDDICIAAAKTFTENNMAAIAVSCTKPLVTEGSNNYFRICYSDPFIGKVLAYYASDALEAQTVYCLGSPDYDYDQGLIYYFRQTGESLGMKVYKEDWGKSDISAYLSNAVRLGAEAIFLPVSEEYAKLALEKAASMKITAPILAGYTFESAAVTEAMEGKRLNVSVATPYEAGTDTDFDEAFLRWVSSDTALLGYNDGGDHISALSALGYDAYFTALAAIEKAGSKDRAAVLSAMPDVSYTGITGLITFDTLGDAQKESAVIKKFDTASGSWEYVDTQYVR
ncbi:MAG: ABC transporter substrate-binding protein [Firmicutes bacterium]|nr:ABC transporter substrate-binding protein [Bacillota bacterium]